MSHVAEAADEAKVPFKQGEHIVALTLLLVDFPTGQFVHNEAPLMDIVPAAHASHLSRPAVGAYMPAPHSSHFDIPVDLAYLPALHARQVSAPVVEKVPIGHRVHVALPRVECVPG